MSSRAGQRPVLLVCLAVFGLMAGQQMLNPILPPLAREFGFSELALGAVWAVGGAGVVLASPFWGRRGVSWGHRPVLLVSLGRRDGSPCSPSRSSPRPGWPACSPYRCCSRWC